MKKAKTISYVLVVLTIMMIWPTALFAQGDEPAAFQKLGESLALGEPGGFIRKFVDLGAPMHDLLIRLTEQEGASGYVNQILAAFLRAPLKTSLIEPLTGRELEVLRLLATEASTREIADTLVVSMGTLRTHTKRIYGELDVHSRFEAVQRAQSLGLL